MADRANRRVQGYDLAGEFRKAFGTGFLTSPSGFVTYGDVMLVAELCARLTLLDVNDNFVAYLGDNDAICTNDGWPNSIVRTPAVRSCPPVCLRQGNQQSSRHRSGP